MFIRLVPPDALTSFLMFCYLVVEPFSCQFLFDNIFSPFKDLRELRTLLFFYGVREVRFR